MTPQEIIRRPVVTERATQQKDRHNKVTLEVHPEANKFQIANAIEVIYGVSVTAVRTSIAHGKMKRRGAIPNKRPNWKKAIVSLKKGDNIDFFATE